MQSHVVILFNVLNKILFLQCYNKSNDDCNNENF